MATENRSTTSAKENAARKLPPGIYKRADTDGKTHFQVTVRLKGYPTQFATFTRLTDAKKWKTQTEAAIRERRHFKTVEATRHTLADRYIRDVLPTKGKSTRPGQRKQLEWWKAEIGSFVLADCTLALIAVFARESGRARLQGISGMYT